MTINYDDINKQILLKFPSEIIPSNISGNILFFKPSDAKQDKITPIELSEFGQQIVDVKHLTKGMWRLKILWQFNGEEYYDEKVVIFK